MRVVAKFGGTSPGSGDRINRAADSIAVAIEHGHEIAIIASVTGSTTDDLFGEIRFEADGCDRAEIVSMGERTNVCMLEAAPTTRGANTLFVEPGTDEWPVITNDLGEADVEATREWVAKFAAELDDVVPVIIGFLAQNRDGEITTLGRGGSDTPAVTLGNYMDADEAVIATDVEGVMTGDPRVVEGARNVGRITVGEFRNLSFHGTEVVASSVLSYKDMALNVRVARYQHGNLLTGRTPIGGEFHNLIDIQEEPLVCLTVTGRAIRSRPGIFTDLSVALREEDISVDSVAPGIDSTTFYVLEDDSDWVETVLHDRIVAGDALSSVTVEDDIAVVRVIGDELPDRPDVTLGIIESLFGAGVSIHDAIASAIPVAIFVMWDGREETLGIIQDRF